MKLAVFHNLPSGGAFRVLHDKLKHFKERGHAASLYSFSTADHNFLSLDRLAERSHVEPLRFQGIFRFRDYFRATRRVAEAINRSDAEWVFVSKCRFFGSPPILRYLKKPVVFYSHEPLRIRQYEMLAGGSPDRRFGYFTNFMDLPPGRKVRKLLRVFGHFFVKAHDRRSMRSARLV
ncbi:MAG: hypothetical protein ACREH5_06800, partial [Candidatus Omnitrophota bacterium]